jgi:hypothetical protein
VTQPLKKLISFNEKVEVSLFDEHSVASIRVTDNKSETKPKSALKRKPTPLHPISDPIKKDTSPITPMRVLPPATNGAEKEKEANQEQTPLPENPP